MRDRRRRAADWFSDIIEWGEKLVRYTSGMSVEVFVRDELRVDAATKCIEAIGEAANRILREAPEIAAAHPDLPLRQAYLARNQLSHGYFNVDRRMVWQMARIAVPDLIAAAKPILLELQQENSDEP